MAILSIGELLGIGPDELSGFVPYTDIHGSGNLISGIGGSALSAGLDSATVSAIASSYAESATSGKQDTLVFSGGSSMISSINGSAIYASGGFDGVYHDATMTGSGLSASPLGVNKMDLIFDSASMKQTVTGSSATVTVRYPVYLVANSADATAQDVVYIVTGIS